MHTANDVIMTTATNPEVLAICYAQGWCASADKMTKDEAALVTTAQLGSVFRASNIVHFDEFVYFVNCDLSANAFRECASLVSIALPSSVTSIPNNAFNGDTALTTITLSLNITSIGVSAFYNCQKIVLTELPSGVTTIDAYAFRGCKNLALTSLPSGVTTIGAYAFWQCININITTWSTALTTIGKWGFRECTAMEQIEIASTCTEIGDIVFGYDYNVHTITCHAMTAPTLGSDVFVNCGTQVSGTKQLIVPTGATGYNSGDWQTLQDTYGYTLIYE